MIKTQLDRIIKELTTLAPRSRREMIDSIDEVLKGKILSTIDSHQTASIVFIFEADRQIFVLKGEHGSDNATHREASWYRAVSKASPAPQCFYIHDKERFVFIVLEYIAAAVTLDEVAFSHEYSDAQFIAYLDKAIQKNEQLFAASQPSIAQGDAADKFLIHKFDSRIKKSQEFPYLHELLSASTVDINGKRYNTPTYYIDKIKSNPRLHRYLTPERIGRTHGDLHFGNILVNSNGLYFIDPNAGAALPLEYDYGKLLHSSHGEYGQIMLGKYRLVPKNAYSYEFMVDSEPRLKLAALHLAEKLTEQQYLRGLYAEAHHFTTMLPNHVSVHDETVALFLRSVQIFHELFEHPQIEAIT